VTVYVSMLRGVNVGGSSRLKSDALRRAYEALGFKDVRTLLQSGNVLFRSGLQDRGAIARRIKQELERELGLRIEVVLRTLAEFAATVERGPVLSPKADPAKLLVMFLAELPAPPAQAALVKWHKGPEMLELRGPEVYLYYPEGVGRSKLSGAVLEDRLGVSGTARNWNTLTKMLEVGRALDKADGRA
jgi:uncharacterized protein (DUF1697 family)